MFGTYVFHWKIENVGAIQHTTQYTFYWENMRMTTRSCSYGRSWRFWVKLKKLKPLLYNKNSKHGQKFTWQDLQLDHSKYEEFFNTSDPANKEEIHRLSEEWCRKNGTKIKSNLKQPAKGPTVPIKTQRYWSLKNTECYLNNANYLSTFYMYISTCLSVFCSTF